MLESCSACRLPIRAKQNVLARSDGSVAPVCHSRKLDHRPLRSTLEELYHWGSHRPAQCESGLERPMPRPVACVGEMSLSMEFSIYGVVPIAQ